MRRVVRFCSASDQTSCAGLLSRIEFGTARYRYFSPESLTMPATLFSLAESLQRGATTSQALTDAALQAATAIDGEGARVFTKLYPQAARAAATASDLLRQVGPARSPIDGLPISIKDLFDVAGETTLAGSVVLEGAPPATEHSDVVKRLIAAGAVIVGKTNMVEFAYSGVGLNPHYGTPRNSWDREQGGRIPGGSSSGAAISVSDGMAIAAIGSDTGGSVRIPSALCGLTGFKPTANRVSMRGMLPLSVNLDSVGAITNSVQCCITMDAILSGETEALMQAADLRGLRLAVPVTVAQDGMDRHVAEAFANSLSTMSAAGAEIREIAIPEFAELAKISARATFPAAEAWAWHRGLLEHEEARYDPRVGNRIRRGSVISAADWLDLLAARRAWIATVELRIAGYDALLMPTVPIIAPEIAAVSATDEIYYATNGLLLRNPTLINFLDGCALSLPCQAPGEAPVGLSVAGAHGTDRRVLGIGLAIEAALRGA